MNNSKKLLSEYLSIITENEIDIKKNINNQEIYLCPIFNLETSKFVHFKVVLPSESFNTIELKYPLTKYPINRNSEILINVPYLPSDCFVIKP